METEETVAGNPGNALSIYGQADAAMDDFPVLKAFQQYIDAEQSKSRKRMIMLCMFFGVLMTILVASFMLVLTQVNKDKQSANDQLIQFLLRERERASVVQQPVVAPAVNPANDAALKAMTDALTAIQQQIVDQKKAEAEESALAATKAEIALEQKSEREAAKLRRLQAQLEEEKRLLADEKERLRQQEIERQRRRLYPDYYARQERGTPPSAQTAQVANPVQKKPQFSQEDIDDILREVDEYAALRKAEEKEAAAEKAKKPKKSGSKKADDKTDSAADRPREYFNDYEYALPVKVNGEDAGFTIPLD